MDVNASIRSRLRRHSAADEVAMGIRDLVFAGDVEPGHPLVESQLAPALGVSRQVVREAIFRLEAEGLVERLPYRGAIVRRLSVDSTQDLYNVRRVLECAAVNAAVIGEQSFLDDLSRTVDAMAVAAAAAATEEGCRPLIDADFMFHRTLVGALGSARFATYYETLQGELRLCFAMTNQGQYVPDDFVRSHRAIADAASRRDGELATSLLVEHLERSRLDVLAAISPDGVLRSENRPTA